MPFMKTSINSNYIFKRDTNLKVNWDSTTMFDNDVVTQSNWGGNPVSEDTLSNNVFATFDFGSVFLHAWVNKGSTVTFGANCLYASLGPSVKTAAVIGFVLTFKERVDTCSLIAAQL